jgi:hypothetical protein
MLLDGLVGSGERELFVLVSHLTIYNLVGSYEHDACHTRSMESDPQE